jgi:glutamate/tyrosine decarboxylase-like PLP-dependent enzyme
MGSAAKPHTDEWAAFTSAMLEVQEFVRAARQSPEKFPLFVADDRLEARFERPAPLPTAAVPLDAAVSELLGVLQAGYCNASHPNYHAYFAARPRLEAVLGDYLGEALNQTPAAWRAGPGATVIESEALAWIADFIGFPRGPGRWPGGLVTGGGHLANLAALKLARDRALGEVLQSEGLRGAPEAAVYMSREGHFSIARALDVLGHGRRALREIEVDDRGRMLPQALAEAIAADRRRGVVPVAVVAIAGTSGSGAVDPLAEVAAIAREHGAWFHVDGAAGAAMARLPGCEGHFAGLAEADSVTLDPCKWLFVPYGIGVLLVRSGDVLLRAFPSASHYWEERGEPDLFAMGPYGSRQIRTLGLWLLFRSLGADGLRGLLAELRRLTAYLADRVDKAAELELLHRPELAVCVFRARRPGDDEAATNQLNATIQRRLLETNRAFVTTLDWRGATYLRVGVNNYILTQSDIDRLVDSVLAIVREDA